MTTLPALSLAPYLYPLRLSSPICLPLLSALSVVFCVGRASHMVFLAIWASLYTLYAPPAVSLPSVAEKLDRTSSDD